VLPSRARRRRLQLRREFACLACGPAAQAAARPGAPARRRLGKARSRSSDPAGCVRRQTDRSNAAHAASGCRIRNPPQPGEPLKRRGARARSSQLRERLTAFDPHPRIGKRRRAEHAAWIERLANERRQPFARSRGTRQHDEAGARRLTEDAPAAPLGDPLEFLLRVGGAQDFRLRRRSARLPALRRSPRMPRRRDRPQARRDVSKPRRSGRWRCHARRVIRSEKRGHARCA